MFANLFPGKIHCLRLSPLPLTRCRNTALAASNAPTQASAPNTPFAVVDYLVQSCGLSSDEALKASKPITHIKAPDNPDSVLRFLREIGLSEEDIRTAVSRDARILCSNLENNAKPNIEKLLEVGFSIEYISGIIRRTPYHLFRFNFVPKIDFLMQVLGSTEFLSVVLEKNMSLLSSSLEKVLIPNISFLKEECGLSTTQIVRVIKSNSRLITSKPEALRRQAERAEQLGIPRSSKMFVYVLILYGYLTQDDIDARLSNLRTLGLSQEEVALLIRKLPLVLNASEEAIARKLKFLTEEAGCDISHVLQNPFLLSVSLGNRLIPRTTVLNLLKSKGLHVKNLKFATFIKSSDEVFEKRFVLPYEQHIPGLHQVYTDARIIKGDD